MEGRHMIISIGRECGSGGHEIGEKLAAMYGLKLYDKNLIKKRYSSCPAGWFCRTQA